MRRALILPLFSLVFAACKEDMTAPEPFDCAPFLLESQAATGDTLSTDLGVDYIDIVQGSGELATARSTVDLNYTLYDPSGAFAQSTCEGAVFRFSLGENAVIPGFEDGVIGMREGGVRRLLIPSNLAYGNGDLTFDIHLVTVY